ncbi:hypothetical protein jhhlp_008161 [Lomentospora prolificans]|uniref:Uncharacterized protein n=1 Tax=Lomentospora prolificans TaxID=41688 RepID=A0A2N3MZQ4_9PEZI|nr:hypothetical protein jhhlp_008161 [Lomentospora prolificans]
MNSVFSEEDLVQLSFLRDEEVDTLVSAGHLAENCRLDTPLEGTVEFSFPEIILRVTPGPFYPILVESEGFLTIENLQMSRAPCDALRARLLSIYDEALQTNTLSMWEAREDLNPYGIFERTMVVSQLVEAARDSLQKYREATAERLKKHHGIEAAPVIEDELQLKRLGEIKSSSEMARELVGSPADVVKHIPSYMRVLHVEEVLRTGLARRFYQAKEAMYTRLSHNMSRGALAPYIAPGVSLKRTEDAVAHIVKPRLTFHGTRRSNVPLIVRHGFLKPGSLIPDASKADPQFHRVQQGATYGQGIYSSPSAQFSLDYSGWHCEPTPANEYFGLKLIVCATLMGRFARVDRSDDLRMSKTALPGKDSHIANRDLEYIVFDAAHILPVYVIHLDWGADNRFHYIPQNRWEWQAPSRNNAKRDNSLTPTMAGISSMTPGDRQRAKEAVMARARKWFPYGYGPGTNGNFVVEDVGEVSDDEEEYGEFQNMRLDEGTAKQNDNTDSYWSWVKAASMEDAPSEPTLDEYSEARHPKDYAPSSLEWDKIVLPDEERPGEDREDDEPRIPEWFASAMD